MLLKNEERGPMLMLYINWHYFEARYGTLITVKCSTSSSYAARL